MNISKAAIDLDVAELSKVLQILERHVPEY
jgi:hypothetical protein